jgi:ABC-2 type transport system ATP-binding protein
MAMGRAAIIINGLHKYYGKTHALRGVSLDVEKGAIFGFLGPNGAGKTTTIRCMLDLIRPQQGEIEILGMDPQKQPVEVRSQIGYLPGELVLPENEKVIDVLHYLADIRRDQVDWDYTQMLLDKLELDANMLVKNLSKGNKQKVGIIQAFMPKTKILLLDEPTAGLDPLMQNAVYDLLKKAKAEGATTFFSSHILSEVEAIADRVAIIRKGVIVEKIDPAKLASMSMSRIRVRFLEKVDLGIFSRLQGITIVTERNGLDVTFQVEGKIDKLIKTLAAFPVINLSTINTSLEETFLTFYKNVDGEAQ